jgi:hypothetical protein
MYTPCPQAAARSASASCRGTQRYSPSPRFQLSPPRGKGVPASSSAPVVCLLHRPPCASAAPSAARCRSPRRLRSSRAPASVASSRSDTIRARSSPSCRRPRPPKSSGLFLEQEQRRSLGKGLSLRLSPLKVPDTPALHSTFACRRPPVLFSSSAAVMASRHCVSSASWILATQSRAQPPRCHFLRRGRVESCPEACAGAWSWCHWAGTVRHTLQSTRLALSTARG